ncbi:MAG: ATP-dependent Clp protease proteolytic subunit [Bacillota bacterium]
MRPKIIKNGYSGTTLCNIEDEMLAHREIECIGPIDAESVNSIISQIRYLYSVDKEAEITIYINSPGGEVSSGLALYDIMNAVKCPIRTVCVGTAASMGALLFLSGDVRHILPHAYVMVHDPLIRGGIGGSALAIDAQSRRIMKTREITAKIFAKHTNKTLEEIYSVTASDTYFDAEEAVAFGIADKIIYEL